MPLGLARCRRDGSWAQQCKNCVNKPYLNRTLVLRMCVVGGSGGQVVILLVFLLTLELQFDPLSHTEGSDRQVRQTNSRTDKSDSQTEAHLQLLLDGRDVDRDDIHVVGVPEQLLQDCDVLSHTEGSGGQRGQAECGGTDRWGGSEAHRHHVDMLLTELHEVREVV